MIIPYVFFYGNCREAMEFYQKCLGGELKVMTYGDAQGDACPKGAKDRVIHADLRRGDMVLLASDTPGTPDHAVKIGSNVQLSINCVSMNEIQSMFKALSEKGKVKTPLQDMFWGAHFGMLEDKYGFHWMLNFEKSAHAK